jgi:hypothetical protein
LMLGRSSRSPALVARVPAEMSVRALCDTRPPEPSPRVLCDSHPRTCSAFTQNVRLTNECRVLVARNREKQAIAVGRPVVVCSQDNAFNYRAPVSQVRSMICPWHCRGTLGFVEHGAQPLCDSSAEQWHADSAARNGGAQNSRVETSYDLAKLLIQVWECGVTCGIGCARAERGRQCHLRRPLRREVALQRQWEPHYRDTAFARFAGMARMAPRIPAPRWRLEHAAACGLCHARKIA